MVTKECRASHLVMQILWKWLHRDDLRDVRKIQRTTRQLIGIWRSQRCSDDTRIILHEWREAFGRQLKRDCLPWALQSESAVAYVGR